MPQEQSGQCTMHISDQHQNDQLIRLAKKYGTPLYVYDGDLIKHKYNELLRFFPWHNTRLYFAVKSNYNPHILRILCEQGSNIDAVSLGEVVLAMKCGYSADRILYTGNSLSVEEIMGGIKLGVLFNIGSLSELEKFGMSSPNSQVCLRFNPNVFASDIKTNQTGGQNSKFGIQLSDSDNAVEIAERYGLKIVGLHEHTGSKISQVRKAYQAIENLLAIAKRDDFPELEFIDFGGGFTVPYRPDERQVDYRLFGERVSKTFGDFCEEYGKDLAMCFEPGRYIVAESGKLIVRVNTLKDNNGLLFAATDSGFPQLIRPAFHRAYHHITNISNPDGELIKYNVCGNICENSDYFAHERLIAEIREGDYLAIHTAGAYGYSMGGVYNLFPMPAEVIILDGTDYLARRRLPLEEMISQILNESGVS